MSDIRVFGFSTTARSGWEVPYGRLVRAVVAASSRQEAREIARGSGLYFLPSDDSSVSSNPTEIASVTRHPGRVLYCDGIWGGPYFIAPLREGK